MKMCNKKSGKANLNDLKVGDKVKVVAGERKGTSVVVTGFAWRFGILYIIAKNDSPDCDQVFEVAMKMLLPV